MMLSHRNVAHSIAVVGMVAGVAACQVAEEPPDDELFDVPLEGLTPAQINLHAEGDEAFGRVFTPSDGLGPVYNASSCVSCHPDEAKGHPTFNLTRFGRATEQGFSPMVEYGGPQLQDRAVPGYPPESLPGEATGATELTPPAITGLGYLEAIDDATLLEMADPEADGISGRVQLIEATDHVARIVEVSRQSGETVPERLTTHDDKYIGRFGKKARAINLLHQTVSAYTDDMGVTTPYTLDDNKNVRDVGASSQDDVADPEVSTGTVSNVVFYLKTLRPPRQRTPDAPEIRAGREVFETIGCADCHRPTLQTGDGSIPQLANETIHPYTDLLLHDMGDALDDGYTEGRATPAEWRTAPLWGLGLAAEFQGGDPHLLHDGRAQSVPEAIEFHGGEAAPSREAYRDLGETERDQLLAFLRSL